ncbi:MAG: SLC13 family permease [Alphaproteobacteria bacterium]
MFTTAQLLSIAVLAAMMALFIWGRLRHDVTAVLALLAAVALGVVTPKDAFIGFSDDIVIIVGSALLVSAAVSRSGVMDIAARRCLPDHAGYRLQLLFLTGTVALLSAVIKNIGALAIMLPIAFQFARRAGLSPSKFLMPMSFAALLGGLMTLIGTSPNIVVARVREDLTGQPFGMFDYLPVGLILAAVGVAFLVAFSWLVPTRHRQEVAVSEALDIKNYTVEAKVLEDSGAAGKTVADLVRMAGGEATIISVHAGGSQRVAPLPDAVLRANDVLLITGDHEAIERLLGQTGLSLTHNRDVKAAAEMPGEVAAVEAVIAEHSPLIGTTAEDLRLFDRHHVNLLAVSRGTERLNQKLGKVVLRLGDIVVLQGGHAALPQFLRENGLLPLAERTVLLGSSHNTLLPIVILAAAMTAAATGAVPVALAFFAAAVAMVAFQAIPLREVYDSIDGPMLVMLAALIPVSAALQTTGATDVLARGLAVMGNGLPAAGALALIMIAAMAVTPFLNNAATVLVMAPIAAKFADGLGYQPDAFLMAVAIGCASDFLTPIGHQCNTLVMGPGGYRFLDYPRLGLPLSVLVVVVAVPVILLVWGT